MVALHNLCWDFLFSHQIICKQHIILNHMFFRYESNLEPVTYSPLLTKHRPRCSEINNYTTHTYSTIILHRWIFLVWPILWEPVEKKSGYKHANLTNWTYVKIILVLFTFSVRVNNPWPNTFFESPKLSLSFFNCSCSPMNVKMEQKGQS